MLITASASTGGCSTSKPERLKVTFCFWSMPEMTNSTSRLTDWHWYNVTAAAREPHRHPPSWVDRHGKKPVAKLVKILKNWQQSFLMSMQNAKQARGLVFLRLTNCSVSLRQPSPGRKLRINWQRFWMCLPICSTRARWIDWFVAMLATARQKSPCGLPSRRCWTASRLRCWYPPRSLPNSIMKPSATV